MAEKKIWNIYHEYDDFLSSDGWQAFNQRDLMATVYATYEEIKAFLEKWDKPVVCGHTNCNGDAYEHSVVAEEACIQDISEFKPYWAEEDEKSE